jgi:alpha 1,3-glucosidase
MNFEILRDANPLPTEEGDRKDDKDMLVAYDTDGMWSEKFGSHTDSKPRGPEAIALDIGFGSQHLYGIPEHASDFALKNTDGTGGGYTDPYRLFNLDVFEYDLDVPMALYGTVPFLTSHDERKSTGMLWLNSAETFVDISDGRNAESRSTHWISESGVIDMFLMAAPRPADISFAYASLTGFAAMPQRFSIAYHQCRWNYKSEEDVAGVDAGFDEHDIPYDVLWLDIEHTDGKKYFTWDKSNFPTPKEMQDKIAAKGRKMVTIVDPHIKRDDNYYVHKEALAKDLYTKNKDSNTYEGWCWPGSVSYLDFYRPEVRDYWISLFALDVYEGSTPNLYTWNDMNEPSVFNGPEVTMQKDNLHLGDRKVEHRNVHNMYGFYHQMATAQGLEKRDNARPFVLTRSFFAGSQKYGAVWTGDNMAKWSHLEAATPMILSLNVAGIVFSGADVGGFFGDPEPELMLRWYQLAAFQPFFRGHAHIDAKRREPWLFGEPWTTHIRTAIRRRYAYLPYIYSVFQESTRTGKPINRPLWFEFPKDKATFGLEQEFMLGDALLIKAVAAEHQTSTNVYLPQGAVWYDVADGKQLKGGVHTTLDTPLDRLPILQRGGTIVPKRERARRSSAAMENDPFTLVVAVDENGQAEGSLYLDDGSSFDYQQGQYLRRRFIFNGTALSSVSADSAGVMDTILAIERVVIYGLPTRPRVATLTQGGTEMQVEVTVLASDGEGLATILRKPDAKLTEDWTIALDF